MVVQPRPAGLLACGFLAGTIGRAATIIDGGSAWFDEHSGRVRWSRRWPTIALLGGVFRMALSEFFAPDGRGEELGARQPAALA